MYADLSVGGLGIGDGGKGVLSPGSCLFVYFLQCGFSSGIEFQV